MTSRNNQKVAIVCMLAGAVLILAGCGEKRETSAPMFATPTTDTLASALTPEPTPTPEATVRISDPLTTEGVRLLKGQPGVVRLAWTTQSEQNSFGFFMMRSSSPEGPFLVANKVPIQGAGTSSTKRNYVFLDTSVRVGDVWYYYPRQVDLDGTTQDKKEWTLRKAVNLLNLDAATSETAAIAAANALTTATTSK